MLGWRPSVVYKYLWKYVGLLAMLGLLGCGDSLYALGGSNRSTLLDSCETLELASLRWGPGPRLPLPPLLLLHDAGRGQQEVRVAGVAHDGLQLVPERPVEEVQVLLLPAQLHRALPLPTLSLLEVLPQRQEVQVGLLQDLPLNQPVDLHHWEEQRSREEGGVQGGGEVEGRGGRERGGVMKRGRE
jgi:hypothetical protein